MNSYLNLHFLSKRCPNSNYTVLNSPHSDGVSEEDFIPVSMISVKGFLWHHTSCTWRRVWCQWRIFTDTKLTGSDIYWQSPSSSPKGVSCQWSTSTDMVSVRNLHWHHTFSLFKQSEPACKVSLDRTTDMHISEKLSLTPYLIHYTFFYFNTRPWSVDSGHGGSADVMKISLIEKKSSNPFFFILTSLLFFLFYRPTDCRKMPLWHGTFLHPK